MRKKRIGTYLLFSILVHMGFLWGIDAFLRSPAEVAPVKLIPVETVVLREEPVSSQLESTPSQQIFTKDPLETKSQTPTRTETHPRVSDLPGPPPKDGGLEPSLSMDQLPGPDVFLADRGRDRKAVETKSGISEGTETRLRVSDLAGPIPKEGSFEPSLSVDHVPRLGALLADRGRDRKAVETKSGISEGTETRLRVSDLAGPIPKEGSFEPSLSVDHVPRLGALPSAREGEVVSSNPMISTFETPQVSLSPVHPSRPDRSSIPEVEMLKVLSEAKTGGTEPYSQTVKKTEAPMGRDRLGADSISELSPIPTVQSPSIPEQKEMTLAPSTDLPKRWMAGPTEDRRLEATTAPIGRNRPSTDSISELPPIPAVQSPFLPEQKEMILAAPGDLLQRRVHRSEMAKKTQLIEKAGRRRTPRQASLGPPMTMMPGVKPTVLSPKRSPSFLSPASTEGAVFLFVLDTSGSVKGTPLEGIKRSAWEFVRLMREKDQAGIMTFNDTTQMVVSFTSEKEVLRRKINKIRTAGTRTVLFDAMIQAIDEIKKGDRKGKFVILFSDGKDEGSQATLQEVINKACTSNISVLCLGYSRIEKTYLRTLESISQRTGGVFAEAPLFQDIIELFRAARELTTEKES